MWPNEFISGQILPPKKFGKIIRFSPGFWNYGAGISRLISAPLWNPCLEFMSQGCYTLINFYQVSSALWQILWRKSQGKSSSVNLIFFKGSILLQVYYSMKFWNQEVISQVLLLHSISPYKKQVPNPQTPCTKTTWKST